MSTRPEKCESCAAGHHRAYCATFPRPCADLIEIWDEARWETLIEAIGTVHAVCALNDGEANMRAEIVRLLSRLKTVHPFVHSQDEKTGAR